MGIPSKVAENSFVVAKKLILVQFPDPPLVAANDITSNSPDATNNSTGNSSEGAGNGPLKDVVSIVVVAGKEAGRGAGGGVGQHPMGVVCTCVRTGWSLMSSLFCVGEEVRCLVAICDVM